MMSADEMNRDLDLEVEPKPAANNNTPGSSKSHGESKLCKYLLGESPDSLTLNRQVQIPQARRV